MSKDTKKGKNPKIDNNKGQGEPEPKQPEKGAEENIPKHRFDEVYNELKDLKEQDQKRKAEADKAGEKKLKEDKKWEELATKRKSDNEKLKTDLTTQSIKSAVVAEAYKLGAVDVSDVYALINKSKIKIDEDGNVTGVEEAVKELSESKAHLFGEGRPASTIGAGSNPITDKQKTYPKSWVRDKYSDVAWCNAKHDDLDGKTGAEFLTMLEQEGRIDFTQ